MSTETDANIELIPATKTTNYSDNGFVELHDNARLSSFTEKARSQLGWQRLRTALDGALSATAGYLTEPTGNAPNNFPLFSYAGYSGAILPKKICVWQDSVQPEQFREFLHIFKKIPTAAQHRIVFVYHDRISAIKLMSRVRSLVAVSERFGTRLASVDVVEPTAESDEIISNLMTENHDAALVNLSADKQFGAEVLSVKHHKYKSHPEYAERIIRQLIHEVQLKQFNASEDEVKYLNSVLIALKLDLAFVMDRSASSEVLEAMALARQLDDEVLIANCQRFATQCLNITNEAVAMLNASCGILSKYPEFTEQHGHILPSYFGSVSNRNTALLVTSEQAVDPGSMENDFWEAKARLPVYQNMSLLGNAAGVAHLISGQYEKAKEIFGICVSENAELTDRLNMHCNLLIAQFFADGSYSEGTFHRLLDQLETYDMGKNWEYLRVRMSLNLMRIAVHSRENYTRAWEAIAQSHFWADYKGENSLDARFNFFLKKRFPYYFDGNRMKGQFGAFVEMYKLFPSLDKDYT